MEKKPCSTLAAVALAALGVGACGGNPSHGRPPQRRDTYEAREPGSNVTPTTDASFDLLAAEGPARFASFQALIVNAGKSCGSVTKAVLTGGLDGTDEWRVDCGDSGRWQVWLKADTKPDVNHCSNARCT